MSKLNLVAKSLFEIEADQPTIAKANQALNDNGIHGFFDTDRKSQVKIVVEKVEKAD